MLKWKLPVGKNANQITVVSDGRLVESGTHTELLNKQGKYAAMWNAEQKLSGYFSERVALIAPPACMRTTRSLSFSDR